MAFPEELVRWLAPGVCEECGERLELAVHMSAAGYYIGTWCCLGPESRESGYYPTRVAAQAALDSDTVEWRALGYQGEAVSDVVGD